MFYDVISLYKLIRSDPLAVGVSVALLTILLSSVVSMVKKWIGGWVTNRKMRKETKELLTMEIEWHLGFYENYVLKETKLPHLASLPTKAFNSLSNKHFLLLKTELLKSIFRHYNTVDGFNGTEILGGDRNITLEDSYIKKQIKATNNLIEQIGKL